MTSMFLKFTHNCFLFSSVQDPRASTNLTVLQGRAFEGEAPESDSSLSDTEDAKDGQRGAQCYYESII